MQKPQETWTDSNGHQHALCAFCSTDCSTHPDAANPFDYCGDCGCVACPDHRVEDEAGRCVKCAAIYYKEETAPVDRLYEVLDTDGSVAFEVAVSADDVAEVRASGDNGTDAEIADSIYEQRFESSLEKAGFTRADLQRFTLRTN